MGATWLTVSLTLLQIISASGTTNFGCKNSLISDQWREKVLELHNKYRRTLAKGDQLGKDSVKLPMSKKTELMHWDCAMEEMAEAAAKDCPTTPAQPTIPGGNDKFGLVFESTNVKGKECNPVTKTDTLIKTWWKEGAKKQEDQKRVQDNDKFAQMAYSESSGLGCTYQTCGRQLYVLCLYGQDAVTKVNAQGDLYPATQQESELCNQCGNNAAGQLQCADALCNPPYTPIVITKSTVCPTCTKAVPEDVRVTALDMHNYYRRLLATGWAKDKKIKYAKPASKMNALVYDKDLEDAAFTYVTANQNDCPTKQEKDIGENFWSGTYTLTEEEAMKEAIKKWWGPLESTGLGDNLEYTDGMDNGAFKYFVNIAHDETKKIGCAAKSCPPQGITVVDCRYDPAITDSDTIYTAGKMPCKPCPSGTTCSKLGGLCEAPATP
ncbi:hypothetical protein Y032_0010g1209 [Ancylostoma ceylanicum]|uniref:SCP domain-containing protein n=1 Tax=Ancylostoma ceylanicum TaxID=53326 RepID=A0A016VG20_9BILA|nr:hypothetical protein Y032_0010g1209 [Ancylostoma ceylanicum]